MDTIDDSIGLPSGWRMKESNSRPGVMYYINMHTNESQWEIPTKPARKKDKKKKEVRCSHILIKHAESRRPSSHRQDVITRSKEEAIEILKGIKKQIEDSDEKGEIFGDLAAKHSDCSSGSGNRRGDLGFFGKGQMNRNFEKVSFSLQVGELSDIVDTSSGVHIIFRTG